MDLSAPVLSALNSIPATSYHPSLLEGRTVTFQFICDSGEHVHLIADAQRFRFIEGSHGQPSICLYLDSILTLEKLLSGTLDGMSAFMEGRYRSDGNIVLSQVLLYLFSRTTGPHVSVVKD